MKALRDCSPREIPLTEFAQRTQHAGTRRAVKSSLEIDSGEMP